MRAEMRRFTVKFLGLELDGVQYADGAVHMRHSEQGSLLEMTVSDAVFKALISEDDIAFMWID